MTDTPPPADGTAALRDAIADLPRRLDRIKAQADRPLTRTAGAARLAAAWNALRDGGKACGSFVSPERRHGLLGQVLSICAALLGLFWLWNWPTR